ncbi:CARDB domain-containing protein [Melioribacter sp. OK-6-Me]|uniref:CARDB domain-containing protein n=1 Tax=unclassified Melioribacter TaxID=2627329 RepID=UPI003ED89E6B
MDIKSIDITFDFEPLIVLIVLFLLIIFAFYAYKYTLPPTSKFIRFFLASIRSIIFIFLVILLIDPIIKVTYRKIDTPPIKVFVDNSNSMVMPDSVANVKKVREIVEEIADKFGHSVKLYTFGESVKPLNPDSLESINFSEYSTNFTPINSNLDFDSTSASVIISDGIITTGNDNINSEAVPLFTVGVGDSILHPDIYIENIYYNKIIYAGTETEAEVVVRNNLTAGTSKTIDFYLDNILISRKQIELDHSGINRIKFNFTPATPGKHKITVNVYPEKNEFNKNNNTKTVFIDVLKNKTKIFLIAGKPSSDFTAINLILSSNQNFNTKKIVFISPQKIYGSENISRIDSSELFILIDFPLKSTPEKFVERIYETINKKNVPFLQFITTNTELSFLDKYKEIMPLTVDKINSDILEINTLINNSFFFNEKELHSLPPLISNGNRYRFSQNTETHLAYSLNNKSVPFFITSSTGNRKCAFFLAEGIWRWHLTIAERSNLLLPEFFNKLVKWLTADNKKKLFKIFPQKELFAAVEEIEFTAEVYDPTFTPVNNASIRMEIKLGELKSELQFIPVKNGIYTARISGLSAGDYKFTADAEYDNITLSDSGQFSVINANPEKITTLMNTELLKRIAYNSNGKYYSPENVANLIDELEKSIESRKSEKILTNNIELKSNYTIIFLLIFLFTIEWFLRKRIGML